MAEISHFRYRYFGRKRYGNPCVTRCVQRSRIRVRVPLRGYTRGLQYCYRVMVMCM